jgi:hypothetical protein
MVLIFGCSSRENRTEVYPSIVISRSAYENTLVSLVD